MFHCI